MGGRVVDCARLESVLGLNRPRGFESLPIRHPLYWQTRHRAGRLSSIVLAARPIDPASPPIRTQQQTHAIAPFLQQHAAEFRKFAVQHQRVAEQANQPKPRKSTEILIASESTGGGPMVVEASLSSLFAPKTITPVIYERHRGARAESGRSNSGARPWWLDIWNAPRNRLRLQGFDGFANARTKSQTGIGGEKPVTLLGKNEL